MIKRADKAVASHECRHSCEILPGRLIVALPLAWLAEDVQTDEVERLV